MARDDRKAQLAARRLLKLADEAEPRTRQQVLRALQELQRSVDITHLERVIASGDYFAMHDLVSSLPSRMAGVLTTLRRLSVRAAREEALKLKTYGVQFGFQMNDPAMIEAARQGAGRLITGVTAETRRAVRAVITRSFQEGIQPRDAAKMVRSIVGLTERQAQTVTQYRARLVAEGHTPQEALQRARMLSERLIRQRAQTIARTETIAAATRGQLTTWRSAANRGLLPNDAHKVWLTTPDDRLCRFCRSMNGQSAPLHAMFVSRFGPVDAPPLHPQCRCAIALRASVNSQRRAA